MLLHRAPSKAPGGAMPLDELTEIVQQEVGADEEYQPGWSTFKTDDSGIYYEGRCIRGHIKDCALQVAGFFPETKNFRAKLVNRVYVADSKIRLTRDGQALTKVDGYETRYIQVMTRQGPRSAIKWIDYVDSPAIAFRVRIMADNIIRLEHLHAVLDYGSIHGLGAERSQGWGRYKVVAVVEL